MAREFCTVAQCEVLYEGFSELAPTTTGTGIIQQASAWIYATVSEFHAAPSTALPDSGISPNFWINLATASEAVYLALVRRMVSNGETSEGFWDVFHADAIDILKSIKSGDRRLDPDPKLAQVGIGVPEAIANEEYTVGSSNWLESNHNVPEDYYEDDVYSRRFYIEIQTIGSTLKTSTFRWKTDLTEDDWAAEGVFMDWAFMSLSHGVQFRFLPDNFADFEVGMMWRITCNPEKDIKNRASGGSTVFMGRG